MTHTPWQLQPRCALDSRRIVCYDSEFVREKSYYPKLALVQLYQPGWNSAVLSDPVEHDLAGLWQQIASHAAPLVLHAGSQDLELMLAAGRCLPNTVRDTQIGFALLTPNKAVSYAALAEHYLGITLDKAETRSDWLARPLSEAQCSYAADDVGLLARIYPLLCADLAAKGRLAWWQEDSEALLRQQRLPADELFWYKLRTAPQQLRKAHLPAAQALTELREQIAAAHDLPRRRVMPDEQLVKTALKQPANWLELAELLPEQHAMLKNAPLADSLFAKWRERPVPEKPRTARSSAAEVQRFEKLEKTVHAAAADLGIHPDIIASPRQMRAYLAGAPSVFSAGWRAGVLADYSL